MVIKTNVDAFLTNNTWITPVTIQQRHHTSIPFFKLSNIDSSLQVTNHMAINDVPNSQNTT